MYFRPGGPIPDLEDHEILFTEVLNISSDAVIIIDGVHEMVGRDVEQFVSILRHVFKTTSKQKLLLSSRDHNSIIGLRERLSVQQTQGDILRFIESEFERPITDNTQLLQQVKQELAEKAKGM